MSCTQSAKRLEKTVTVLGSEMDISLHSPKDAYATGKCLGYIAAAVDSIPVGEGFDPPVNVRLNQYMDVVLLYLHNNPDKRHEAAYYLVRVALSNAFPTRH
jgi:Rap1a immunity proteins